MQARSAVAGWTGRVEALRPRTGGFSFYQRAWHAQNQAAQLPMGE